MDKQLFDDAIGEVPPATFHVDGLVTRGRRAVRLHRLTHPAVAAAAAVVVLTGAVAFGLTRDDAGGLGIGGQPVSTETSGPASHPAGPTTTGGPSQLRSKPPEACSRTDLESAGDVKTRLTGVLRDAIQDRRTDLTFSANPDNAYPDGVQQLPLEFYQVTGEKPVDRPICDRDSYFMAGATITSPEGRGNILVVVQPAVYDPTVHGQCSPERELTGACHQVTDRNGDTIIQSPTRRPDGIVQNRVDIYRPDGTWVMVAAANTADSIKSGHPPTASAVPLTMDQLIGIGTVGGMTLFP